MGITAAHPLQPVPDTGRSIMDDFRWEYLMRVARARPKSLFLLVRSMIFHHIDGER